MQAREEDLKKVLEVTKEQISISLKTLPSDLDKFKQHLKSFDEVNKLWTAAIKEKTYNDYPSVIELKEIVTPEILDLIKQQRLTCLIEVIFLPLLVASLMILKFFS